MFDTRLTSTSTSASEPSDSSSLLTRSVSSVARCAVFTVSKSRPFVFWRSSASMARRTCSWKRLSSSSAVAWPPSLRTSPPPPRMPSSAASIDCASNPTSSSLSELASVVVAESSESSSSPVSRGTSAPSAGDRADTNDVIDVSTSLSRVSCVSSPVVSLFLPNRLSMIRSKSSCVTCNHVSSSSSGMVCPDTSSGPPPPCPISSK
mmetsp:Transcript_48872/g.114755  ORF Transcript_48872/g.114755 Transcript_48872/m.114755 type:complete len:206 (-) Transcript_48872:550-1167(-)